MKTQQELFSVFAEITDPREMEIFFKEIFTSKEMETLVLRWQLLKDLYEGQSQRSIAAKHRISLCKITRGSKILKKEDSVTKKILDAYYAEEK